jgi:uncharacterized protein YyaL (SSP411 family)
MANRLASSTSPYLRQHAGNPVDWWPWSDEAFEQARRRGVPVLLSVGYAACHWCHVMAHESFEDEQTAAQMNAGFVNVKVDREERPDVDSVYMDATQAMTGHGGWPMTCFLTPEGEPFYCGTYFPPRSRGGIPGFRELLAKITEAWTTREDQVRAAAGRIAGQLADRDWEFEPLPVDAGRLGAAVVALASEFDREHGGFGGAPKFPPSMLLEFLLRHHERTGSPLALEMVDITAERMARGGMYDQLAGGFARYSVDGAWVVPHFEKMLYDNALLLRAYAHLARLTGSSLAERVARETAEFIVRDLGTEHGAFASSLDADTDGVEGLTYVWTPAQLVDVLGPDDGRWAAELFAVTKAGTFEHGSSVLQLPADPDDQQRFTRVLARLLEARAGRPQPPRDDKVITAWNGLAITALAEAGAALGHPQWIAAATAAGAFMLSTHVIDGRLRRGSRAGQAGDAAAVLEDYGAFAQALLTLHQVTGQAHWLSAGRGLLDAALARFADPDGAGGRYYDTADDAERLVVRPRDPTDNATPSGAASLAEALLTASALDHETSYRSAAEATLSAVATLFDRFPRFTGHWLTVAETAEQGPIQVAIAGSARHPATAALLVAARRHAPGGSVILAGEPDGDGAPLLAGRPLIAGEPAAYVCRGFACLAPVSDVDALIADLRK